MNRHAILCGLGDYYQPNTLSYRDLRFTYKNIQNFQERLIDWGWIVPPPILNTAATKSAIFQKLEETVLAAQQGDTLLFYFTGHGERFTNPANDDNQTFLVTATEGPKPADPTFSECVNDVNYQEIIQAFSKKGGHLITIIDCCYAMGLVDGYNLHEDFHTVIAASSENSRAYYTSNSLFFTAFKASWNASTMRSMRSQILDAMDELNAPNRAKIFIATNFESTSLKNLIL